LFKRNEELKVKVHNDVVFAGSLVDRRFTSRYCMFLGANLVTWRSKKRNVIARFRVEAEF